MMNSLTKHIRIQTTEEICPKMTFRSTGEISSHHFCRLCTGIFYSFLGFWKTGTNLVESLGSLIIYLWKFRSDPPALPKWNHRDDFIIRRMKLTKITTTRNKRQNMFTECILYVQRFLMITKGLRSHLLNFLHS